MAAVGGGGASQAGSVRHLSVREAARVTSSPAESPAEPTQGATSWASSAAVRAVMRANKARDTQPELALRRAVHALGLRYRVNGRPDATIRRTADLIFTRAKVAVFLDGCFWHGCPQHHRPASTNSEFWRSKIAGNRSRDIETDALLTAAGWTVVRVWEHEHPTTAATRVADAVVIAKRGRSR